MRIVSVFAALAMLGASQIATAQEQTPEARIDTALTVPRVSTEGWTLQVKGYVDRPITLTYRELLDRPMIEADITMSCVSNEVGGDLISTARWLGCRLDDLLGEAGIQARADQVVGRSVDGFTAGFPTALLDGRDAIVAVGIGLLILPRTWNLMRQALRILMEVAPRGIDVNAATAELAALPGVREVHDLHIWTLTSGMEAATVHIVVEDDATWHRVLDRTRRILTEKYAVTHPTIQLEPADHVEAPVGF